MKKKAYDIVYLTNTPSFYKLNLCNEIARNCSMLLIFYGYGAEAVNTVVETNNWQFDYKFINKGDSNKRNRLLSFIRLCRVMSKVTARKVIYAGWLSVEYDLYALFSPKRRNVIVCESSILDVSFNGFIGWCKKLIINRMSTALPSGIPHKELFESIGFSGDVYVTGSVGIFNKSNKEKKQIHNPLRYLYVGRLVNVKNIGLLIDVFNANGLPLTIVGDGVLSSELKIKAKKNIQFTGFIENDKLADLYLEHDVFILPSTYEPWGLVVEEALYNGLPVIVSDKVGCGIDLVKNTQAGVIFTLSEDSGTSLQNAINEISENYEKYSGNVNLIDWNYREQQQIMSYLNILR